MVLSSYISKSQRGKSKLTRTYGYLFPSSSLLKLFWPKYRFPHSRLAHHASFTSILVSLFPQVGHLPHIEKAVEVTREAKENLSAQLLLQQRMYHVTYINLFKIDSLLAYHNRSRLNIDVFAY